MRVDIQNNSLPSLGEMLCNARIARGETIDVISKKLRIQVNFLEALEKDDYDSFPAQAFRIGFLKTYAQYLNIDPEFLSVSLKKDFEHDFFKTTLHFPRATPEKMFPSKKVVYVCIFALICLSANFSFKNTESKVDPEINPLGIINSNIITQDLTFNIEQPKTQVDHEANHQILYAKFKALGKCWIEVRKKEKGVIFDQMLKVGEELEIEFEPEKSLKIGNAGGIETIYSGQSSGPLGEEGSVISSIPLDSREVFLQYILTIEKSNRK